MGKKLVRCDKCKNVFFTSKIDKVQCGSKGCGNRFDVKGNVVKL